MKKMSKENRRSRPQQKRAGTQNRRFDAISIEGVSIYPFKEVEAEQLEELTLLRAFLHIGFELEERLKYFTGDQTGKTMRRHLYDFRDECARGIGMELAVKAHESGREV